MIRPPPRSTPFPYSTLFRSESGHLPSLLLWGPAGSGKTTLAFILGKSVGGEMVQLSAVASGVADARKVMDHLPAHALRSEEHTSELQSRSDLVCRLLLGKKN